VLRSIRGTPVLPAAQKLGRHLLLLLPPHEQQQQQQQACSRQLQHLR
jgi:hypothetical protein